jgi:hypothetical protein
VTVPRTRDGALPMRKAEDLTGMRNQRVSDLGTQTRFASLSNFQIFAAATGNQLKVPAKWALLRGLWKAV